MKESIMKNIEISSYGELLVYKKWYTPDILYKIIKEKKLKGLRIVAHLRDQRLSNIDFLKDCTFLEGLDVISVDDFDFGFLQYLSKLKSLGIGTEGVNKIDLSNLKELEYLSIDWRKKVSGIENCKNLKILSVYRYTEMDLSQFKGLTNLKKLIIKTSSILSIDGINELVNLENITLSNCKKLRSIKALNGLKKVEELEFNSCRKIEDFSTLVNLPNLKTLYLIDCKHIHSIKFINNFPLLNEFGLLGDSQVIDGDMTPAKRIKRLTYRHRSHYNEKIETPEADELEKRNIAFIKKSWDEFIKRGNTLN